MNAKIVSVFKHRIRTCVVVEMSILHMGTFHNGYVSIRKRHNGEGYDKFAGKIEADELTFAGDLSHFKDKRIPKELWFLGFDSNHCWNDERPISKTFDSVKARTIELANELVEKGI